MVATFLKYFQSPSVKTKCKQQCTAYEHVIVKDIFEYPLNSRLVGSAVTKRTNKIVSVSLSDITKKFMYIPCNGELNMIQLCHSRDL